MQSPELWECGNRGAISKGGGKSGKSGGFDECSNSKIVEAPIRTSMYVHFSIQVAPLSSSSLLSKRKPGDCRAGRVRRHPPLVGGTVCLRSARRDCACPPQRIRFTIFNWSQ